MVCASAFRRVRIATMAVALSNPAISIVDFELGRLRAAQPPPLVKRRRFGLMVAGRPLSATAFYVPAPFRVGNNMMCPSSALLRHLVSFKDWRVRKYRYSELQIGYRCSSADCQEQEVRLL